MREKRRNITVSVILIACIFFMQVPFVFGADTQSLPAPYDENSIEYIKSTINMIEDLTGVDITSKALVLASLKGLLETTDSYTRFLTAEEARDFADTLGGVIEGIGIATYRVGNYFVVSKVFPDSPAEKAGIIPGDKIININGINLIRSSIEDISKYIMGDANTNLQIDVIREGYTNVISLNLTRKHVVINPVSYEIREGIGYIKIDFFNEYTSSFVAQALSEMDGAKVNKIILDLRDNPGGNIEQAANVARYFVPKGLIARLTFKSRRFSDYNYYSVLESPKYKVAVLVNETTASSAEILAGSIQDTKAGTLVGTKTYGKARVQNLIPLLSPEAYRKYEKEYGVKFVNLYDLTENFRITPSQDEIIGYALITTGFYYTTNGRLIDGTGLSPDIAVPDSPVADDLGLNNIQRLRVKTKPSLHNRSLDVYNAERILKILGYDIGSPGMEMDERTFEAIKRFQNDSGLFPYGVLDFATQKALNGKLNKLILQIDKQYARALEILNK